MVDFAEVETGCPLYISSGAVENISSTSQVRWERNSRLWQLGSHFQGMDPNSRESSSMHGRWKLDDRWAAAVELLKLYLMNLLAYGITERVIDARIFLSLPPAW